MISIVIPTHNEEQNIEPLMTRLFAVIEKNTSEIFEVIFVDDSNDQTCQIIESYLKQDSKVRLIKLTRSFGQTIAISAGLDNCLGDAAIIMDADLQDPPELIPDLISAWKSGNHVVYVERESTGNLIYKSNAKIFYSLMKKIATIEIPPNTGEFRIMDRRVIEFLKGLPEKTRFLRGLSLWPGFKSTGIKTQRSERIHGSTKYNLFKSTQVAISGFTSFSVIPLKIATWIGIITLTLMLVFSVILAGLYLFTDTRFAVGWLSLVYILGILNGSILLILGIIGEYISLIYLQVINRPKYVIDYIK
jgi:dolichol-phosphate mannosyltransferase